MANAQEDRVLYEATVPIGEASYLREEVDKSFRSLPLAGDVELEVRGDGTMLLSSQESAAVLQDAWRTIRRKALSSVSYQLGVVDQSRDNCSGHETGCIVSLGFGDLMRIDEYRQASYLLGSELEGFQETVIQERPKPSLLSLAWIGSVGGLLAYFGSRLIFERIVDRQEEV